MMPEAANMEEILAQKKYGRPFSELSEDEKAAIYQDYEGLRDVQNADYMQGQELFDKDITQGIQAGNVYVGSGPGNALAEIAMKYAGKKKQDAATAELGKLSEQYSKGSRAGGEVAAYDRGEDMNLLKSLIKNRQQSNTAVQNQASQQQAPPPPAASAAPPPPPQPPPPQAMPPSPVPTGPQGVPGAAGDAMTPNIAMSQMMQGNGTQNPPMGMGAQMPPQMGQQVAGPNAEAQKMQAAHLRKMEEEEKLRAMGIMR